MSISSYIPPENQLPDLFNLSAIRAWLEEIGRSADTILNISVTLNDQPTVTIYFQDDTKVDRVFTVRELYGEHGR